MDKPREQDSPTAQDAAQAFRSFRMASEAFEKTKGSIHGLARRYLGQALGENGNKLRLHGPLRNAAWSLTKSLKFQLVTGYRRAKPHPENGNLHYPDSPEDCVSLLAAVPGVDRVKILKGEKYAPSIVHGDERKFNAVPDGVHRIVLEFDLDFSKIADHSPAPDTIDAGPGNSVQRRVLSLMAPK